MAERISPSRWFQTGFLRVVAWVETSPALVRFFEGLFRRFPALERLVLGKLDEARAKPPQALVMADGSVFYLPCDDGDCRHWRERLAQAARADGQGV